MAQIKIEICIDNDAFYVDLAAELRRIFAQIDERLGDLAENGAIRLLDSNGNSVGTARSE